MSFLDWLVKNKKPLSRMTRAELRREELTLEKQRNQLLSRVEKLAGEKQKLFEKGFQEKTPEVRRVLAQEFELKTTEQLMLARQLNVRSKEKLTISRMRMLVENHERAKASGGEVGLISERDILRLNKLIENDAVTSEMYQERLDRILQAGQEADEQWSGMSTAGQEVMNIWDQMDAGTITDASEGFDEADRRVRQRQAPEPEE